MKIITPWKQLCEEAGTQVVVENAGVLERGNRLFDEQEFIDLCRREQYAVLIDIGHAWANGWSLKRVVNALADQIVAYHLTTTTVPTTAFTEDSWGNA
ncbi:MAG: hypothetical protein ACLR8P_04675 [Clostridium fessum]